MVHYRDVGFEISGGGRRWKRWRNSEKWFLVGFASRSMEKRFLVVTAILAFLDLQVKVKEGDREEIHGGALDAVWVFLGWVFIGNISKV
ncbi:hypothetical protein LR48_Vigan10g054200 [Vigna angularis]|uniref:Uncharacterized protein n=1 Tax=Phaseolus angularis TaxID=3914 RepID=A0A0L9VHV5_PHAAN|nr:hypothetical protein LR48_Vigan10g054200 [Vigna angularis]